MRDIQLNATEDFPLFTTRVDTGAPTDVTGIVVSAYPDNSATQITAGITVTSPDSIAGYANIRVVATVANGYAWGSHYTLVITTGTVNSVSVVGGIVGEFSIRKNTAALIRAGLLQSATGTTAVIDASASATNDLYKGAALCIVAGTGAGQSRIVTGYTGASKTCTVDTWTTNPDNTSVFELYFVPPASASSPIPVTVSGTQTFDQVGNQTGNVSGSVGSVSGAVGSVTAGVTLSGSAGIKKNTAKAAFMFLMTDSTLHAPATGLTVTATRSLDGAAFGACANAVAEIGNGVYKISLAAGDLNADTVFLKFTAALADPTNISIVTGA